jgi:hypothetical protein
MLMVEKIMNWREFSKSTRIRKLKQKNCLIIASQVYAYRFESVCCAYLLKCSARSSSIRTMPVKNRTDATLVKFSLRFCSMKTEM